MIDFDLINVLKTLCFKQSPTTRQSLIFVLIFIIIDTLASVRHNAEEIKSRAACNLGPEFKDNLRYMN